MSPQSAPRPADDEARNEETSSAGEQVDSQSLDQAGEAINGPGGAESAKISATDIAIAEMRRQLAVMAIGPDCVREVRVLAPDGEKWVASGYFDNVGALVEAVVRFGRRAKGFYVSLNPVNPALLARAHNRLQLGAKHTTMDADVARREFILLDFDARRPSGISSTDQEHERALRAAVEAKEVLSNLGIPVALDLDTGNGAALVVRVDLTLDEVDLVRRVLAALAFRFDDEHVELDQTVFNAARLCRLAGTSNRKGDSTPVRPHRRARLLDAQDLVQVVDRAALEQLAALAPHVDQHHAGKPHGVKLDVDDLLAKNGIDVARTAPWSGGAKWILRTCPFDSSHTDLAAFVLQFANGAMAAGCHHSSCRGKNWQTLRALLRFPPRDDLADGGRSSRGEAVSGQRPAKPCKIPNHDPFPIECLSPLTGRLVADGGKSIGCSPSFLAVPLLSVCSSLIGNTYRIELKRGWTEPAIIWTATVGESGTQKSPALDLVMLPIRRMDEHAQSVFEATMKEHAARYTQYEKDLLAWKRDKKVMGPPPEECLPPVLERFVCSDTTIEALAILLRDRWRGLLMYRDELSGWLNSFNQYRSGKGGDVPQWLEVHGGRPIRVDRKTGAAPSIYVPRAAASVTGGIQPGALAAAITRERFEDGLMARLLFAYPPRRVGRWTEAVVDEATLERYCEMCKQLADLQPDLSDGKPQPRVVPLSPEAKTLWIQFHDENATEQETLGSDLAAAWSKLTGYAARIALVIHLMRIAEEDVSADRHAIDARSMECGIRISRWFAREAERVYAAMREDEAARAMRQRVEVIKRDHDGAVTVREWRGHNTRKTTQEAREELQELVDHRLAEWRERPPTRTGGRPTDECATLAPPNEPGDDDAVGSGPQAPSGDPGGGVSSCEYRGAEVGEASMGNSGPADKSSEIAQDASPGNSQPETPSFPPSESVGEGAPQPATRNLGEPHDDASHIPALGAPTEPATRNPGTPGPTRINFDYDPLDAAGGDRKDNGDEFFGLTDPEAGHA